MSLIFNYADYVHKNDAGLKGKWSGETLLYAALGLSEQDIKIV